MRKVLHVSHSLDTGGGPLYIKKIVQDIPQIDHHVVGNSGYYYTFFRESLGGQKVRLLRGKNLFYNILTIRKFCKEKSISVIHCHGRGAGLYSRLIKFFIPRIRIVYTVHGFHPDTLSAIVKLVYILTEKILYHLTDAIINVSQSERQLFMKKVRPSNTQKIHYIPNYITKDDVSPQPLSVNLDSTVINFLYVGRLSHEKGIDILLKAWSNMANRNCKLYIIGYGPLENLISTNSNKQNIIYLGKVENAGSVLLYFNAIIIPSRFEGMPYVGLEAMASKACVIVTPAVGITDLFTPGSSYMAKDFSSEGLLQAIESFIQDFTSGSLKITDKIELNYKRVQLEFSQQNAAKIYKIYESFFDKS